MEQNIKAAEAKRYQVVRKYTGKLSAVELAARLIIAHGEKRKPAI